MAVYTTFHFEDDIGRIKFPGVFVKFDAVEDLLEYFHCDTLEEVLTLLVTLKRTDNINACVFDFEEVPDVKA